MSWQPVEEFRSEILRSYLLKTKSLTELLPQLYMVRNEPGQLDESLLALFVPN